MALRHSLRNFQSIMLRVVHDLVPVAVRALLANDGTAPTALVARNLGLGEHAGHDLLAHDADAMSAARCTFVNVVGGGGAGTAAVVAKNAFLDHEVDARAGVDVREGDFELADRRGTLAHLVISVSATEEVLEHVEGVRVWLLAALVCLETFFAMAVINLPFRGVGKYLVGCRKSESCVEVE